MKTIFEQTVKSVKALRIVVMEVENESTTVENQMEISSVQFSKPDIKLSKTKGMKVNFIRFIYALCVLGFFVDSNGQKLTRAKVFQIFGQLLDEDFSNYSNHLNRAKQDNTQMDTQTNIFEKMMEIIRKRCGIF